MHTLGTVTAASGYCFNEDAYIEWGLQQFHRSQGGIKISVRRLPFAGFNGLIIETSQDALWLLDV